jgi:hypothetical protein
MIEDGVDDAGAVERDHDRQPPRHRRRPEPAHFLQPAHEQLDVDSPGGQRVDLGPVAPAQKHLEIRLNVKAGRAFVARQVRCQRYA